MHIYKYSCQIGLIQSKHKEPCSSGKGWGPEGRFHDPSNIIESTEYKGIASEGCHNP